MNSYVHQYPAALFSAVTESGYRGERFTGEALRSGRALRSEARRPKFRWLRRGASGTSRVRNRVITPVPAPSPHH
jgi:hypothetical protein